MQFARIRQLTPELSAYEQRRQTRASTARLGEIRTKGWTGRAVVVTRRGRPDELDAPDAVLLLNFFDEGVWAIRVQSTETSALNAIEQSRVTLSLR